MIDYFALLDQPQQPSLEMDSLTSAYHAKARETHPDAGRENPDTFATLNEAFQTLRDPRRRLHHLLTLHGHPPDAERQNLPQPLADLFPEIMATIQTADGVLNSLKTATTALARSLQQRALLEVVARIAAARRQLSELYDAALEELEISSAGWRANPAQQIEPLTQLYFRLTYLGRWLAQLEDRNTELSLR